MSLVIAKKEGIRLFIVGDTKLTSYPKDLHPGQKVSSPNEGVIKTIIINPHFCICFAGDLDGVDDLIMLCRGIGSDLSRIQKELLSFNRLSGGKTEFILAVSYHPFYKLFEIKNLQLLETNSSWIGSRDGFGEFQRYWTSFRDIRPTMGMDYHMKESLKKVIESSIEPSVNGFVIAVNNENKFFNYGSRIEMYVLPQVLPPGFSTIGHGTAQQGGYSVHFFPSNDNYTILAIHILQGKFGVIYKSRDGGVLWPEVVSNVNEAEFSRITESRFGVRRLVSTPII